MDIKLMIRRLLAFVIDWNITLGVFQLLTFFGPGSDPSYIIYPSLRMFTSAGFFIGVAFLVIYPFFKDCIFGRRSLGKLICGLRIVNSKSGNKASFGRLILRNLTFWLIYVEMILVLVNRGRRLGDLLAGTSVVRNVKKQKD